MLSNRCVYYSASCISGCNLNSAYPVNTQPLFSQASIYIVIFLNTMWCEIWVIYGYLHRTSYSHSVFTSITRGVALKVGSSLHGRLTATSKDRLHCFVEWLFLLQYVLNVSVARLHTVSSMYGSFWGVVSALLRNHKSYGDSLLRNHKTYTNSIVSVGLSASLTWWNIINWLSKL